jgi:purine-binding chemotaxis protein CheW
MSTTLEKKSQEILIFEVEGRRYGLPSAAVKEIVPMVSVVPLPEAQAKVEGVINVRGNVVPVLNARSCFGLPARAPLLTDHLIVALAGDRLVALRVDRALDLVRVDGANIEESRSLFSGAQNGARVAKLPNDLVLVHDLATFLAKGEKQDAPLASFAPHLSRVAPPEGGEL